MANGGAGVMEPVRVPYRSLVQRRSGAVSWTGTPKMSRAVQRDDDTGSTNTSYGPGETQASRTFYAEFQRALDFARSWEMPVRWSIPQNADRRCEMLGEQANCDPPLREVRELADLNDLDVNAAGQLVRLVGFEAEEEDLILRGWALLQQHFQLAWWVVCVIGGQQSWIKLLCLAGYVLVGQGFPSMTPVTIRAVGRSPRSIFRNCEWLGGASGSLAVGWLSGGTDLELSPPIYICVANEDWAKYLLLARQVSSPFRMCAVIYVAALLFHELLHACGIAGPDTDARDLSKCYESYRMDNSFAWALFQVYPGAAVRNCCDKYSSQGRFNNQLARGVSVRCLER